jgi:pimeloyl-ACP methyl ester carboxylesterase
MTVLHQDLINFLVMYATHDAVHAPKADVDWTFGGLWPYEPHWWFETDEGRMHYVDEGPRDSRPVVLVHGAPTWGFLYRNFIDALVAARYRAIVLDHLGFGRLDKPTRPDVFRISGHVSRLEALLESLDLHDATVVPHDWGGQIELSWAVAYPEQVACLFIPGAQVIMNLDADAPEIRLNEEVKAVAQFRAAKDDLNVNEHVKEARRK